MLFQQVFLALLLMTFAGSGVESDADAQILSSVLDNKSHLRTLKPDVTPVKVTVNILVRSIENLNEHEGTFSLQMTFRQEWNDPRLAYSGRAANEFISITNPAMIWTPDLFFSNSLSGFKHKMMSGNDMIRIFPNGNCLYSSRVTLRLQCIMDLSKYPLDTQTCQLKLASYAFTEDDMLLRWKVESPIQLSPQLEVPGFEITKFETGAMPAWTTTGSYGSLFASFTVRRSLTGYWITIYVMFALLVILSYLAFWIRDKGMKFLLSLVTLLTGCFGTIVLNESLPRTSYAKAIDIWVGICLSLLTLTLLLLLMMDKFCHTEEDEEKLEDFESATSEWIFVPRPVGVCYLTVSRYEKLVRIVYPATFTIISVLYFLVYFMK